MNMSPPSSFSSSDHVTNLPNLTQTQTNVLVIVSVFVDIFEKCIALLGYYFLS